MQDESPQPPIDVEVRVVGQPLTPRLRVRRVNFDHDAAVEMGREAVTANKWRSRAWHGGGVANKYGYPAETEAMVAVASPTGRVAVWWSRLPANKVTTFGAAFAALSGATWNRRLPRLAAARLWDRRCPHKDHPYSIDPFAWAALRVMHAAAFEIAPTARDCTLAELGVFSVSAGRPPIAAVPGLSAQPDVWLAVEAMILADEVVGAMSLMRTAIRETATP